MERKPQWLKTQLPQKDEYGIIKRILKEKRLHTVCVEARCPNLGKCWDSGTATFMILGNICTRSCRFCATKSGNPNGIVDEDEPLRLKDAVIQMKLDYVVMTSVDRDDLIDKGASIFKRSVDLIKKYDRNIGIEVLAPDFGAERDLIEIVIGSGVDVFAHNIEVVKRLSSSIRDRRADYDLSLETLKLASETKENTIVKSGIMVGLGETDSEVIVSMKDAKDAGVKLFTIGQYLQPTKNNYPVDRYVTPETFKMYEDEGKKIGLIVKSGPLVRSSFEAKETYFQAKGE